MGMKRPTASVCIALCRGAVSSYPASICGRAPMRRGRPPFPSASSTGVPARSAPTTVRRPRRATASRSPAPSTYARQPFDVVFPIPPRHGAESGRTAKGMTGYAVEFHIPTEHFMSSLTKVSSTTRARHRAWIRRHARGVWRAAIEAGAYRTERFVALAMVQWPGPRSTRRCPARRR